MSPVAPSRVALTLSVVVLGVSVGVFATTTGVASAVSAAPVYEFDIANGALVTDGDESDPLVADVTTADRIEIRTVDGRPIIHTEPRRPPEVSVQNRSEAKRIVRAEEPIADAVEAAGGAVYTVRPVPAGVASDRAAVLGADTDTTWSRPADGSGFVVRGNDSRDALVLDRPPRDSPDRLLVVVHPMDTHVRYSAVVNLSDDAIDSFVRVEPSTA